VKRTQEAKGRGRNETRDTLRSMYRRDASDMLK
jgi:hypothetical protein